MNLKTLGLLLMSPAAVSKADMRGIAALDGQHVAEDGLEVWVRRRVFQRVFQQRKHLLRVLQVNRPHRVRRRQLVHVVQRHIVKDLHVRAQQLALVPPAVHVSHRRGTDTQQRNHHVYTSRGE